MKIKKVFMFLIFFSIFAFVSITVFAASSSNLPKNFNSNGDLIKGWYWLGDNSLQNYAQWTFENIPPGENDLTLEITALASDRPNGRKGLPAEFLLIYEVPGGNIFVTQKVTLPNDSSDYTCRGQVTIPRSVLHGASVLFVRAERISFDTNHVAFNKKSIKIIETVEVETYPPSQETQFYQGSQLPDTSSWDEVFLIQPGIYNGSLGEQITSGKRDTDDYYSIGLQEGQIINLQLFMPSNANFKFYLYRPGSTSSIVRNTTKDNPKTIEYEATESGLWRIKVHRSSGEGNYRLSINISGYPPGQTDQSQIVSSQGFIANKFYSNGDLFEGWYWLRDPTRQHYAEWTFENIPPGTENLVLDITALATDRMSKGRGISAEFLLIYGVPGGDAFVTQKVTLPNVSLPDDPVGYTCHGQVTIPRSVLHGASVLFLRAERISPDANYVAFNKESIKIIVSITYPPYQGSQLPDTNSWDEAFFIQPGIYTGSLGGQTASGKRDKDDYYSINLQKGQIITLQLFMPSNAKFKIYLYRPGSVSSRAVSPTPQDNMTTLQYEATESGLWRIKVHRSSGEGNYRLSINISGYPSGQTDQSQILPSQGFIANEFSSNGNLNQGWYWLQDSALQHCAEWTFENIPPGNTDLTLEITVLATNQAGGGRGFSARFLLIFGFPGSGTMGGVFQTVEITLPNVSPPSDTVGYTCHGVVTIPRDFIPAATTIFLRVERISPNDNHVAFNSESINLFTEEQITGFREIQSTGTKK